ncbi:MAG TPA: phage tail tape measure protein, partial [Arenicellales bacterium]|nr:phage tail tape measure protein [Arenicellales bacterium]
MSIGGGGLSVGSIAARLTVDNTQWSRGFQSARQDLRGFNQDVQQSSRNWQQIGQRMQSFGRSMTIGVTTPILAAGAGMLKAAGDAEAAATRLETTFGPAVQDINSYLRELQEVAPASMADLQNSASDAMGALTTLGIEQERANEMTQEALEVTANLSAHMDRDFSETLRTIQAGYAGNTQSLRDMAYNITQAEIESRALEMGLVDQGEAVMGAERAMAVHNLVMEQSEGIMGAAEAQADTFNVQLRDLWATVQDTGAAFGEILIPHLSEFMEFASGVVTALGDLDTSTQTLILGIGGAAAAIGPLAVAAGTLMTVLAPISGTMVAIGAAAAGLVTAGVLVYQNWDALSERFPVLTSGFERIIDVIRAVGSIAADVFPPLVASVVTAGDIILQTWESIANIINTQVDNLVLTVQGGADAIKALAEGDFRGAYGALSDAGEEVLRNNEDLFDDISDGWFGVADAPETYGNALEFVEGLIGDVGSAWDDMTGSGEYATAAMEGFTQRTGELGTAAMESKSQIDDTADSVDHLGRQYQLLHDRVDEAAGRMGHWESMNADAEQALELLEEEIERTGDSTGELTRKKEDLEWWIRRTEGGIRDEAGAYVDS